MLVVVVRIELLQVFSLRTSSTRESLGFEAKLSFLEDVVFDFLSGLSGGVLLGLWIPPNLPFSGLRKVTKSGCFLLFTV